MIVIENNQVYSTEGKYVHKLGTDTYFHRATVLPSDTLYDFEEVEELPRYTKAQYDAKVEELIRERYTDSEEFALQRKMINATSTPERADNRAVEEYEAYNAFVEECKVRAKEILNSVE